MTPKGGAASITIPAAYRDQAEAAIVRLVEAAIEAGTSRNDDFSKWDAQLRSDPYWHGVKPRWRGGCMIESTLTRQYHLSMLATSLSVLRAEDWWMVSPTAEEDAEAAGTFGQWLNDKVSEYSLADTVAYDLLYNAGRHTYAICYCGWKQEYETTYATYYEDKETQEVVQPDKRLPDREYTEFEDIHERVTHEGLDFRVPHTSDVFFWPPNARTPEEAHLIIERFWLSPYQLVNGVDDEGYDAEAVRDILRAGPGNSEGNVQRYERDQAEGLIADENGDYEVLMVIGKPPLLLEDGKTPLNNEVRRRDYMWLLSRAHNKCFKFAPLPYNVRPYAQFHFLREPGRQIGDAVTTLVGGYHLEDTLAQRFRVDGRDLSMAPTLLVPEPLYQDLMPFSIIPGGIYPYSPQLGPNSIKPLPFDHSFYGAAIQDSQDFQERAGFLFSAQSRGLIPRKDQTATEVSNAAAGADEKADLYLSNFFLGLGELAHIMISHYQQFKPDDAALVNGSLVQISPEMLEKRFRINATGSSRAADPQLRQQRAEALYTFALQNPLIMQRAAQGDMSALWSVSIEVLRALDVRTPQALIGQQPTPPPNADTVLQQLTQMIMQGAQGGDPTCRELLMVLQQLGASMQPGPAQGGQPGVPMPNPPVLPAAPPAMAASANGRNGAH